jgi:tetratricopeptide (TPR) repeat protein
MLLDVLHRLMQTPRRWAAAVWEFASNIGAAIVSPFERLFAATIGRAFYIVEHFERVEDVFAAMGRLATWPVRMLGRVVAAVATRILPASVRDFVGRGVAGWFRLQHWLGEAIWRLIEWLNLDAATSWIVWLSQPVWRPIVAVGGLLYAWLMTRPYRQMVWGVPILVLLFPLASVVLWGRTWGRESVAAHYREAVQSARESQDLAALTLYERKLGQLGDETQMSNFRAATALENQGNLPGAYAEMRRLAPEEKLGYIPAHHWILIHLLGNQLDVPPAERLRIAGVHLAHLESLGKEGRRELDLLRGVYLAQTGLIEEGAKLLEPLTGGSLLAAMQRMQINLQLHRLEEAQKDARALRLHLRSAEGKGAKLTSQEFEAWAQAEQLLGERDAWGRVVRAWLRIDPQNAAARRGVAALDLVEFNEMLQSPYPNADALAQRLLEMASLMDDTRPLDERARPLYAARAQNPPVAAMFERILETPDAPLPLIACLGAAAAMEDDIPLARRLLASVVAKDPKHVVAWNNYAWTLAREPDSDYKKALVAVNKALEQAPSEFRFRETRGQIYVALERWQEAVDDLEFALNGIPDMDAIHIGLATSYDHLGKPDLAAIHRQQVQ